MSNKIVFSHANGFPSSCYDFFFQQFVDYEIDSIPFSGKNLANISIGWTELRDELISFIENKYQEPVIGLGHSMGAVFMLLAAEKKPELFKKIILMDPPIMGHGLRLSIQQKQKEGSVHDVLSVAQKAKIRKDIFPSMELVERVLRGKSLFQQFHPICFQDYLKGAFTILPNGKVALSFPKELEYTIFCTIPSFEKPISISVPVQYIFANSGEIFDSRLDGISELEALIPSATFTPFEGGHLFPFEKPKEVADLVITLIKDEY